MKKQDKTSSRQELTVFHYLGAVSQIVITLFMATQLRWQGVILSIIALGSFYLTAFTPLLMMWHLYSIILGYQTHILIGIMLLLFHIVLLLFYLKDDKDNDDNIRLKETKNIKEIGMKTAENAYYEMMKENFGENIEEIMPYEQVLQRTKMTVKQFNICFCIYTIIATFVNVTIATYSYTIYPFFGLLTCLFFVFYFYVSKYYFPTLVYYSIAIVMAFVHFGINWGLNTAIVCILITIAHFYIHYLKIRIHALSTFTFLPNMSPKALGKFLEDY